MDESPDGARRKISAGLESANKNISGVNERHISGNERHKANRSSQNHPPHETEKVLLQKVIYE
jgi:hypothetical protein